MPHAGVQLRVADQKLGDLGVIAASGIAVQRVGVVLFQFVIQTAAAENRVPLFRRIFQLHLPEKKDAELRPEVEVLYIVIAQHGGAAQQPFQQFPSVRVAADHARQFRIKALEGRKLQQKTVHRQVKAPVNMLLKICKHLSACLCRDLRAKRFSAGHALRGGHKPQRIANGFF